MKIQYLGTAAAEGIPACFCNCNFCKSARLRGEFRARSQVLFDGELSIDFPPDVLINGFRFGVDLSAIKYFLITHSHFDHFDAMNFTLHGYKYAHALTEPLIDIYANRETLEIFRESTRLELRRDVAESIRLHELHVFERTLFDEWCVYPLEAQHSSQDPFVFLLEKQGKCVLHLHDTGKLTDKSYCFLTELGGLPLDLVTLDCTFLYGETQTSARHMGLDEIKITLDKLETANLIDGHTKRVITHFSHNANPTPQALAQAEREFGVIAAYDGLTLEI